MLPSRVRAEFIAVLVLVPLAVVAGPDGAALYAEHCASCHGVNRLGASGPALLPDNLGRLTPAAATEVVAHGRAATQMPAFARTLDAAETAAVVAHIFTPADADLHWDTQAITASRVHVVDRASLAAKPGFTADPLNLFVVVESGDHHVSILNGDDFTRLARFPSRFALHGGPKFSRDGRYVYCMSRDGWITAYDMWNLGVVGEVRAGINSRNIALSHDGRVIAVANTLPHTLVMLDSASLLPLAVIAAASADGAQSSRVSAVYQAPTRASFVVALKDLPEVWEVAASAARGFPITRTVLAAPLDDFFFDPSYRHLIGASRAGGQARVVDLDRREVVKDLPLGGLPHLGSGISFDWQGRRVLATLNLMEPAVSVIDMRDWSEVKRIATAGPGMFMRSHAGSPYAFVDTFMGRPGDQVHVIDKRTLEIVKTLRPAPGKTTAHVEFTRDGRYALLSVWDKDGAIIVYDTRSLEEVRRIPASKPSGKYNVWNKITFEEGTSH